jgi:hypothetical protein
MIAVSLITAELVECVNACNSFKATFMVPPVNPVALLANKFRFLIA